MVWLMLRDNEPTPAQLALLEPALVSAVDYQTVEIGNYTGLLSKRCWRTAAHCDKTVITLVSEA